MFGNRDMIDESSSRMIDESDYTMIDDIKEERRRGPSHYNDISNSHLCEEGGSHDRTDRQASASYNRTPNERAYTPPNRQYVRPAQPRQPYVQPQQRPVQTTVVNGRTYQRPVQQQPSPKAQTSAKASAAIMTLIFLCIVSGCLSLAPVLITCIIMIVLISKAASKTDEDGNNPKLQKLIPAAFIIVIIVFILSIAGSIVFAILNEMLMI